MFKSFKKRATTVFRKKKGSTSQLPITPETDSTPSFTQTQTHSTLETRRLSEVAPPQPPPPPPPSPPRRPATPAPPPTPPPAPVVETEPEPIRDLLHFDEPEPEPEPVAEQPVATHEPESNSFAPKYVPFVESSPLRNNMFGGQTSVYGRVNPDIMGGFGGDDESIWLVDDEETDEEQQQEDTPRDKGPEIEPTTQEDGPVTTTEPPAVVEEQLTGATAGDPARPAFVYRAPALLDDDEWLSNSVSTPETQPEPPTPIQRRGYAPISTSILDLSQFDFEEGEMPLDEPEPTKEPAKGEVVPPTSSSSSTNPYVALFEQQDNAMTVAYLRRLEKSENTAADDFSFGQRYQKAADTSDVIVTHQRVPRAALLGEAECIVCAEYKAVTDFPRFSITAACTHPPNTCLECIQMSIESDLNSKLWTEIRCPECRELLEYADIQRYANKQTFMRYETLAIRAAMSEAENFVWCTSGCGSGQIHESGDEQPIVTCLHCNHRSCFHHSVAWHENISCSEYDQLLADPENFRSRIELENEEWTEAQRAQLEADRAMAQGLLAEEQAEVHRREERARQEREQARKAAELIRQIATRRRREEKQSQATLSRTTKPCPGCGWAIEKNDGCSHMTCIKCRNEFCWACYNVWTRNHSINCRGGR